MVASRYSMKVDKGHPEIVDALRAVGATVQSLAAVGVGCPDLLVGYAGRVVLMEVKSPKGPDGGCSEDGQKLQPSQVKWAKWWKGPAPLVVRSVDDALAALGVMT